MLNIKEIAKQSGFYFHDAGYAPIEHTLPREYSEMCFDRFALNLISCMIEEISSREVPGLDNMNRVVEALSTIRNGIQSSIADK